MGHHCLETGHTVKGANQGSNGQKKKGHHFLETGHTVEGSNQDPNNGQTKVTICSWNNAAKQAKIN